MGSTRLPGKVLKPIGNHIAIDLLLTRLSKAKSLTQIVVATSDLPQDDKLADHLTARDCAIFRGSENDVLGRYAKAAQMAKADVIVRITGDCPYVDPDLVDEIVQGYHDANVDYYSNVCPPTFPDGMDVEVFSADALTQADTNATSDENREHVTSYLIDTPDITKANFANPVDLSHLRLTLDDSADLVTLQSVSQYFAPRTDISWREIVDAMTKTNKIDIQNSSTSRNEGGEMGMGQKLWKRAKAVIPGGNMLLSKRSEMFLPNQWPSYFSRTKGITVWDIDDKEYLDMGVMGVGTNTLGYSHPEVDAAVAKVVTDGNLSTLNAPEEVYLAERMVELHPWADMVRFARTGGEANAIAIRIGRAASGRDGIAMCGYHGWHDWYLAANLAKGKNLDGHLLPGLEPRGVPRELGDTTHPFNFNDFEALEHIVATQDIGVIKMEVMRNAEPENDFLHRVRKLADDKGIVLIFDECTSGFRETFGGLHKKYGVDPDLAVFGKTLGNGYAVTCVIGRKDVMQAAQTTFISSTFWTERIGSAAALKTLEVMEREKSWDYITDMGHKATKGWQNLADSHGLKIEVTGLPAIACYGFVSDHALEYQTYLTQDLLEKGYLASTCLYSSMAHTDVHLSNFLDALDPVFAVIADCERGKQDINVLLKGPVCHSRFKRLN